jgi:crotonobetainyl-CoA:carnitine CoA-transferase CaiB-like acyl-CoA transferase
MQAFEGIRVLDLTHVLAGPFATYQLAVLGADVIKIEAPHATDMNREIGPVDSLNASFMGSHFQSQGGNKRAMTLNLKTEEGRKIFLSLARDADVIVENFRSGAMDRLGLGYEDIRAVNPDIIYCSITGFGQTGPKRGHGAFDNVIQAYSGMMMATGHADGPAVMVGPPVLDYSTGAQAAFAISSALLRRERTGKGQRIDVAMLDAALMLMASGVLNVSLTGQTPKRSIEGRDYVAAYGCFDTADEKLMLGVFTVGQHARMWRALGREDLARKVEGLRNSDMPKHRDHDEPILVEILKTRGADEWEAILNEAGVPAARVRTLNEALLSEQVASRSAIASLGIKGAPGGTHRTAVAAFGCSEDGPCVRSSPAEIGEHTEEIIVGLGYSPELVEDLRRRGVV